MNVEKEIKRIVLERVGLKHTEINGMLYLKTDFGENKYKINQIRKGYFEEQNKEFDSYREYIDNKDELNKWIWFTDIYEIYKIFDQNILYQELEAKTYYIEQNELQNWKKFVFQKITASGKKIFILQSSLLIQEKYI